MYNKLQDAEWLRNEYVESLKTLQQIADKVGCHRKTVWLALQRHGIKRRTHTSKYALLNDKEWLRRTYVEEQMSIKGIAERVGSTPGNVQSHLATMGITTRGPKEANLVAFPEGRDGHMSGNWQGGRRIIKGYVFIYAPEHPYAGSNKCVQEHRLVMEKKLDRYLEPYEVVHHLDGDRQNNDPSNLVVKVRGKHISDHFQAGHEVVELRQRVADLKAMVVEAYEYLPYHQDEGLEGEGWKSAKLEALLKRMKEIKIEP